MWNRNPVIIKWQTSGTPPSPFPATTTKSITREVLCHSLGDSLLMGRLSENVALREGDRVLPIAFLPPPARIPYQRTNLRILYNSE